MLSAPPIDRDPAALAALLAHVDVGLIVVDGGGVVRYCNPRAAALLGLDPGQLVERSAAEAFDAVRRVLVDPDRVRAEWRQALEQALTSPDGTGIRQGAQDAARERAMIDGTGWPSFDFDVEAGGKRRLRASVFSFVHPGAAGRGQETREDAPFTGIELRDVSAEDAADRDHRQFASEISHELKQPISVIAGSAELMTQPGADPDTMRVYAQAIREQSDRLTSLLNDLLDLQRIGTGALRCQFEAVDLRQVIHEALEPYATAPTRHAFAIEVADDVPAVRGDHARLRQVLSNLISNAVKYSPAGDQVQIAAVRDGAMVRVSVSDEGIGIPRAALPRVFTPFYRTEAAERTRVPGHGLGLALAKSLVELHGGQIGACSTPGKGSTFFFTVPVAAPAS